MLRGRDHGQPTSDAAIVQLFAMTRIVAADVLTFAGVDAEEAMAAVRRETAGQGEVADPPSAARHPLTLRGTRRWARVTTSVLALVAAAASPLRRRRRRRRR